MKRVEWILKDASMATRARITCMENETPKLEPWLEDSIEKRGWFLVKGYSTYHTDRHGAPDWKQIADSLAESLRALTDEELDDEDDAEEFQAKAQVALDSYDLAHMEESLTKDGEGDGKST